MTRRRWIADKVEGNRAFLLGQNAEHLAKVLRARAGQEFEIATDGRIFLGRITEISEENVTIDLLEEIASNQAQAGVTLYLAIFKFDRMEWAIEKATELGVAKIVPLIARRSDSHLILAAPKRVERWCRIAREASQQSRRDVLPEILDPVKLKHALQRTKSTSIVLSEQEDEKHLAEVITQADFSFPISLAIGPEGGWTDEELAAFTSSGWVTASLGQNILRAETAAIAALAIAGSAMLSRQK